MNLEKDRQMNLKSLVLLILLTISKPISQISETYLPTPDEQLVGHRHYVLDYNEEHEQPNWVMYRLSKSMLLQQEVKRKDCFKKDKRVKTKSASVSDYTGSGYDKGHLCPSADMLFDSLAMVETFFMSNMSPQKPQFNRGIWKKLESFVRTYVTKRDGVYVVTGPILENNLNTIGKNKVSVPNQYYKVLVDVHMKKGIAFLMDNEGTDLPLDSFVVPIDSIETITGIDFFPQRNDEIEKHSDIQRWK